MPDNMSPLLTFDEKIAKSSQVTSITYDPEKRVLSVIFKATPAMYDYQDFPPDKWAELQVANSLGSYLYRNVTRPMPGETQPPYRFVKTPLDPKGEGKNGSVLVGSA